MFLLTCFNEGFKIAFSSRSQLRAKCKTLKLEKVLDFLKYISNIYTNYEENYVNNTNVY